MKSKLSMAAAAALIALGAAAAAVPGRQAEAADAAAGERVFKKCVACHVVDEEKHKTGPHLVGVMGREAGSLADFKKYSKALKESGIVWDEPTLDAYLEAPRKVVKGGTMAFAGLKKAKDRADVIAYLRTFSSR